MAVTNVPGVDEVRPTRHERELARRDAANTSRDFPLLPTSDENPSPKLPEDEGDELTPARRVAIAALVSGQTFTAAARAAGVTPRTLYTWRREPAFARTIDALTRDALATTATRVRNLMLRATRVLGEAMDGPEGFRAAIRVANSGRLWAALNAAERALADTGDEG